MLHPNPTLQSGTIMKQHKSNFQLTMRHILFALFVFPLCLCAQPGRIKPPTRPTSTTTPVKPTTGTLSITSTPSGAAVKVDGRYKGETPLILERQKPGTYSVTFSAEGYESKTQSVTVTAGKTATCSVTLKKKQTQQTLTTTTAATAATVSSASSRTFTANGVSFKMIRVEGQGSPFYIGETEVTQALWEAVMGSNPSHFKGTNQPVGNVSWDECKEFIRKLNSLTGKSFRLPKEKEWEYAAKGGNKSHGYEYSGSNNIDEVAWYDKNSYYCGSSSQNSNHPDYGPHNVKTKRPNELGIYDMSGNVGEWCEDLHNTSSLERVCRGGSWLNDASFYHYRNHDAPSERSGNVGLRLAL